LRCRFLQLKAAERLRRMKKNKSKNAATILTVTLVKTGIIVFCIYMLLKYTYWNSTVAWVMVLLVGIALFAIVDFYIAIKLATRLAKNPQASGFKFGITDSLAINSGLLATVVFTIAYVIIFKPKVFFGPDPVGFSNSMMLLALIILPVIAGTILANIITLAIFTFSQKIIKLFPISQKGDDAIHRK